MQLTAIAALLALATGAAPADAGKARVTIQVLSARAGEGATGEGVDPRLAAKLRVSLEQMGMRKPDIAKLSKPRTNELGPGETAAADRDGAGIEVTCKKVSAEEGVTLSVALFNEVKEGKKTVRRFSDPTSVKFSKAGQVQPFVQGDGKGVRVYVVSAVREGDDADADGGADPPK